jgi:four helix bundle protein
MAISSFRDLRVWQAAMDLVERIYRLTRTFPKYEIYGLAGQMQRAVVSVPSNIAEGHTREHRKEFLHHLSISQASLAELQTHLEIAARLDYCSPVQRDALQEQCTTLAKQLYSLRNALMKKEQRRAGD